MCEQTPVDYKDGDVVWVKLGPCWWPGEVRDLDKLPAEWFPDFKKRPIAAVKFFDEDTYEYVKTIDKIYSYNCSKKNEFIKKGLDLYRGKNAFMHKFPADVSTAERKTDGDPSIIDSPQFSPEKKKSFTSLLFGATKSPKKSPRKSVGSPKRTSASFTSTSVAGPSRLSTSSVITHPRFLGNDDHEVRILLQSPETPEAGVKIEIYDCTTCGFKTSRIDVIVLHNKSHIQGVYSTPTSTNKRAKKTPAKKVRKVLKMSRSKTTSIIEDLALIDKGLMASTESSDENVLDEEDWDDEPQPKRKRKKNKRKPKKVQAKKEPTAKLDIRDDLLAEWEDDSEAEGVGEGGNLNTSSTAESDASVSKVDDLDQSDKSGNSKVNIEKPTKTDVDNSKKDVDNCKKDTDKSCFDFEEEEENEIIGTAVGRKIPRVIPHTDRQKTVDPGKDDANLPTAEEDVNRKEQIKEVNNVDGEDENDAIETKDPDVNAFKGILDATVVPDLPAIPHSLKCEQNFHNAKTIKFPDKSEVELTCEDKPVVPKLGAKEVTEVSAKLINPKKRFVKSFEDFEQQWNIEQKKLTQSDYQVNVEQNKSVEPEQQLDSEPQKLREPDSPQQDQDEKQASTETVAAVEKEQISIEAQEKQKTKTVVTDQQSEKTMGETKQPEHQPEKLANVVEVSKLKTQLMSKLESGEKLFSRETRAKKLESQARQSRSPRERILDRQREERADDLWFANKFGPNSRATEKLSTIETPSKKSKLSDSVQPKSMLESSTPELNESDETLVQNQEINTPKTSLLEEVETFTSNNETKNDTMILESKTVAAIGSPSRKSKRLSVKMPEIEETVEIDQTTGLLEPQEAVTVEQAELLDVDQTSKEEVLQMERIVTETPRTELQVVNENQIDLDSEPNPILAGVIELNEQPKLDLKQLDNCNAEQIVYEDNLNLLTEPPITEDKENEVAKSEEASVESMAELQQPEVLHIPEISLPEEEPNKHMDELYMQLGRDRVEEQLQKSLDADNSRDEYDPNTITFSSLMRTENNTANFRIDNKDSEDLSALTTLAAVSELTTNLEIQGSSNDEKSKIIEGNLVSVSDVITGLDEHSTQIDKSKTMEGNLTFVTEDDLADGQVEIADISSVDEHKSKPITLTSFSVDFTDPNQAVNAHDAHPSDINKLPEAPPLVINSSNRTSKRKLSQEVDQSEVIEKSLEKVFEDEISFSVAENVPYSKSFRFTSPATANVPDGNNCDIEDQIPSLVVCTPKQMESKNMPPNVNYLEKAQDHGEYTSSSKLLEILTDSKPKPVRLEAVVSPQKSPSVVFEVAAQPSRKIDLKSPIVAKESASVVKGVSKFDPKNAKFIIKSTKPAKPTTSKSTKPIILSEQIIKPVCDTETVSVQKVTSKRSNQDIEDIDAFIIQKPVKKLPVEEFEVTESILMSQPVKKLAPPRGKARILQQTIIKPAGEVIQPATIATTSTTISHTALDDNMFDINSMPIVLGDQILTAEGIESMPVVLSDAVQSQSTKAMGTSTSKSQSEQLKLLNKPTSVTTQPMFVKTYSSSQKLNKSPRLYQAPTTKVVKTSPAIITRPGKPDKFIIVPSGSSTPTGSKFSVGKRPSVMKRASPAILPTPATSNKVATSNSEPTGNKIMIVTNQQGQQSRVLLTPAQQKLLGYQATGSKLVKSTLKGNILQKASNSKSSNLSPLTSVPSSKVSSVISHTIVNSKGEIISTSSQNLITADGQVLMPVKTQQLKTVKTDVSKSGRKVQTHTQKVLLQEGLNALRGSSIPGQQKTIVIKNQQGQVMRRFQGTNDALLEQQVAAQVQAIKASGSFNAVKGRPEVGPSKMKPSLKRSYPKKSPVGETARGLAKTQLVLNTGAGFATPKLQKTEVSIPPLAPISPKRSDTLPLSQSIPKVEEKVDSPSTSKDVAKPEQAQQKPVTQILIQDALGNQCTITEGQILALPSGDTIDGQPQSYMLVTLDETGNLTPLNNEALLSLDPNLCLGGDLSNMVLQIDDGAIVAKPDTTAANKNTDANADGLKEVPLPQSTEVEQKEVQESNAIMPIPVEEPSLPEEKSSVPHSIEVPDHSNTLLTHTESMETAQQNLAETVQTVTCSIGSDPNQQLIITGDPISTQKFIESLTEGNPDLANLLASAEGNILIQTDEQQILINTDADNPVLMPMSADNVGVIGASEGDGNPMFATQPAKNQDILAAALADTDVFQQEHAASPAHTKMSQSQLSPSSGLYPSSVGNVLGTTLSLSSPIMTPLEVPSSNNKKILDEDTDILTREIPKNVDLPITITDPNISQTVAQQQVASLLANDLANNLDLPLTITDQGVPLTSAELNSPSYVYSLPSLDESVDIHQKAFSGPISMPLLTEEPHEVPTTDAKNDMMEKVIVEDECNPTLSDMIRTTVTNVSLHLNSSSSANETSTLFHPIPLSTSDSIKNPIQKIRRFLGTTINPEEGLCRLGGEMCSSLSEPPPDMFDLAVVPSKYTPETILKQDVDPVIPESTVSNISETTLSCEVKPIDSNVDMNLSSHEQNTNVEEYDRYEIYDSEGRNDGTPLSNIPLNSESSSPAVNIDENSCEIPVQPQIVTDLSSSSFETHETTDSTDFDSNKRSSTDDSIENDKKKMKFD